MVGPFCGKGSWALRHYLMVAASTMAGIEALARGLEGPGWSSCRFV